MHALTIMHAPDRDLTRRPEIPITEDTIAYTGKISSSSDELSRCIEGDAGYEIAKVEIPLGLRVVGLHIPDMHLAM